MPTTMIQTIDTSEIHFGKAVHTRPSNNGKYVETTYRGQRNPVFQLCKSSESIRAPFGISAPYGGGEGRSDVQLNAPPELVAKVQELEERLIATAVENTQQWFGRKLDEGTVRAMHSSLIKTSAKYEPTLKIKVDPSNVKLWKADDRSPMTKDELLPGFSITPAVFLGSVWFMGKSQFGLTLGLKGGLVTPVSSFGLDDFVMDEEEMLIED